MSKLPASDYPKLPVNLNIGKENAVKHQSGETIFPRKPCVICGEMCMPFALVTGYKHICSWECQRKYKEKCDERKQTDTLPAV